MKNGVFPRWFKSRFPIICGIKQFLIRILGQFPFRSAEVLIKAELQHLAFFTTVTKALHFSFRSSHSLRHILAKRCDSKLSRCCLSDVPQHESRSHLATATAGLLPNIDACAGKGCEERNVDSSGLCQLSLWYCLTSCWNELSATKAAFRISQSVFLSGCLMVIFQGQVPQAWHPVW